MHLPLQHAAGACVGLHMLRCAGLHDVQCVFCLLHCRVHHYSLTLGAGDSHVEALGVAPAGRQVGRPEQTDLGFLEKTRIAATSDGQSNAELKGDSYTSQAHQKPRCTSPPAGPPSTLAGRAGGSDSGRLSTVLMKMMRSSCKSIKKQFAVWKDRIR